MARTKTPTAQLKLQGTYREDKNGKNRPDEVLPTIIDIETKAVETPKNITDVYVKQFYQTETKMLIQLQLLTPADLPEIETMCLILQQMRNIQTQLKTVNILTNLQDYEALTKLYIKLSNTFSSLAVRYYVSPTARMKLNLDCLNLKKGEKELESPISRIINKNK